MDLENTEDGIVERINPLTVPPGILSVHSVRYEFAAPFCAGKKTLDIACGAGYGTALLADTAFSVVGGDADDGAIDFARTHYTRVNATFDKMDALHMAFPNATFDRVVSFETIEHLSDRDAFLAEVTRVLSGDGVFIVSTPLVPVTNNKPANPHHFVEYSLADFDGLLRKYFREVDLYGQMRVQSGAHRVLQALDVFGIRHRIPSVLRKRATRALATVPYEDMDTSNQVIVKGRFDRAHDMVAVCRIPVTTGSR